MSRELSDIMDSGELNQGYLGGTDAGDEIAKIEDITGGGGSVEVVCNDGGGIPKGYMVGVVGSTGSYLQVEAVDNSSEAAANTLGMASTDMIFGGTGIVVTEGIVEELNTSAFFAGLFLYLGTHAGQLQGGIPTAPEYVVSCGTVIASHATEGSIYIKVKYYPRFRELSLNLSAIPADGEGYFWNNAESRFELSEPGGLTNWEEDGTTFQPLNSGYDLGAPGYALGNIYILDNNGIYWYDPPSLEAAIFYDGARLQVMASAENGVLDLGTFDSLGLGIWFYISGEAKWEMDVGGDFVPATDNDVDLGESATRVRKLWVYDIDFSGTLTGTIPGLDYWEESGTSLIPNSNSNIGIANATNQVNVIYIEQGLWFGNSVGTFEGRLFMDGNDLHLQSWIAGGDLDLSCVSGVINFNIGGGALDWVMSGTGIFYSPTPKDIGLTGSRIDTLYAQEIVSDINYSTPQNGIIDTTESTISFTDGTRTFSIQPVGVNFDHLSAGVRYVSTGATLVITDVEGLHYIYFDGASLVEAVNPTDAAIDQVIRHKAICSIVYWDATNSEGIYVGDERHGVSMSPDTHSYLHFSRGLEYLSGLALVDFDINSGTATEAQFGIDAGAVADEDLYFESSAVASTTGLPVFWKTGAAGEWRSDTNAGYSFLTSGGNAVYNEWTGATWQQTAMGNNDYFLMHIFATTDLVNKNIAIMGEETYNTQGQARAGALVEILAITTAGLPSPELRPIASVIFRANDGYTAEARVNTTDEGDNYIDWRNESISRVGISTTDHGLLSGLLDDDHPQYLLANGDRNLTDDMIIEDGVLLLFGTDSDMNIQHTGAYGHIDCNEGGLYVDSESGHEIAFREGSTLMAKLEPSSTLAAGETSLWLWDEDASGAVQVTVGADDSGGAGYKVLRIPN